MTYRLARTLARVTDSDARELWRASGFERARGAYPGRSDALAALVEVDQDGPAAVERIRDTLRAAMVAGLSRRVRAALDQAAAAAAGRRRPALVPVERAHQAAAVRIRTRTRTTAPVGAP